MADNLLFKFLTGLNKIFPKKNQVLLHGNTNLDDNTINLAWQIHNNYDIKVYYSVSKQFRPYVKKFLPDDVEILESQTFTHFLKCLTSKYLIFTFGSFLSSFPKNQVSVNVWHGILYKKIKKLRGMEGIEASITVGTSPLTKIMFSKAFGVVPENVTETGYPRNDSLLKFKDKKTKTREMLGEAYRNFDKLIVWMPTFRENRIKGLPTDGTVQDNPFNLESFDLEEFNTLLKSKNAVCIFKPHPAALKYTNYSSLSNIHIIDDKWIADKGITIYRLLSASDMLISDVSSVIIDYMLLDNPIISVCADINEYGNTRGFYFDNIREWLPSEIQESQTQLHQYLGKLLDSGIDPSEKKRIDLKNKFFTYQDAESSNRLSKYIFGSADKIS